MESRLFCSTCISRNQSWEDVSEGEQAVVAGANDYLSIVFQNTTVSAATVTGYIKDGMQQLYDRGARKCAPSSSASCRWHAFHNSNVTAGP